MFNFILTFLLNAITRKLGVYVADQQVVVTERRVVRLSEQHYQQLRSKLSPTIVNHTSTPQDAAYILGQQRVLELIREGFHE